MDAITYLLAKKYTDNKLLELVAGSVLAKPGSKDGTISINDQDIAVTGLKSAAFVDVEEVVSYAKEGVEELISEKASQKDLDEAVVRIETNETNIELISGVDDSSIEKLFI